MDLVSLYVDQRPESDLSRDRAERFPQMKIYPTVADTLTLGGSDLAVDGVLLIGEHGSYPTNEKGQHLYPRYELFMQIVSVYRTTGKTAPHFQRQTSLMELGIGQKRCTIFLKRWTLRSCRDRPCR